MHTGPLRLSIATPYQVVIFLKDTVTFQKVTDMRALNSWKYLVPKQYYQTDDVKLPLARFSLLKNL
jgi:hypothetical protein